MLPSQICDFYNNKNVFITGGTGFLGKLLIEKLLRDTNIGNIYVLMRNKKGKNVEERFEELFHGPLFAKLESEKPLFRRQIDAICGDCAVNNLGLSNHDEQKLKKNVNIVFHVAATVRFNEHIKTAYAINVKGTENLMKLCKEMEALKGVVHVSTALCNFQRRSVDEIIYSTRLKYKQVEDILSKLSYEEAERLTPKFLESIPNTYIFTKALTEEMLKDEFSNLPLAIFRPGGVISTYKEPLENWSDARGSTHTNIIVKLASLGLLRIFPAGNFNTELVPADLTTFALIASAWDSQSKTEDIPVYNYVSSVDNPLSVHEFLTIISLQISKYPSNNALWAPKLELMKSSPSTDIHMILQHYPLAVLLDFLRLLSLKKPQVIYSIIKMHEFIETLKPFIDQDWKYSNKNVKSMWDKMNETDRILFNFDIKSVQWVSYLRNYVKGVRLYFMKEDLTNLTEARIKFERLQTIHKVVQFLINFLGQWWMTYKLDEIRAKL